MDTNFVLSIEQLRYASPSELEQYEQLLKLQEQLTSPLDLMVSISRLQRYPHQELINRYLMALMEKRLYKSGIGPVGIRADDGDYYHPETGERIVLNLALSAPPRAGKSEMISTYLPAWFILTHPQDKVILSSAGGDYASEYGDKVRNIIIDHPEFGVNIRKNRNAADRWSIDKYEGGMYTAGAYGQITGRGADLLICDDPVKSNEDAFSPTQRDKLHKWWHTTFASRGDMGRVPTVLMHTRWHEDDLLGRLLKESPDEWVYLNIPAISFDEVNEDGISIDPDTGELDPLRRPPGLSICDDLRPLGLLRSVEKVDIGTFSALFQGKPSVVGGGIFKKDSFCRFRPIVDGLEMIPNEGEAYFLRKEDVIYTFGIVDLAATMSTRADYTVIGIFQLLKDRQLVLRKLYRFKLEAPDHEKNIRKVYVAHNLDFIGIEDVTFGKAVIQKLIRNGKLVIRKLKADSDKMSRAIPAGMDVDAGVVFVPADDMHYDWVSTFLDEVTKFPNAAHDDQVDVLAYASIIRRDIPARREKLMPNDSMAARIKADLEKRARKQRNKNKYHPELGRWP